MVPQVLLYYGPATDAAELAALRPRFRHARSRLAVLAGDLVIARYCHLDTYRELAEDVIALGGRLINSYAQHRYIADLQEWYRDLAPWTPTTWFQLQDVPKDGGPFVLKGATFSIKQLWSTHMFAADFAAAVAVHGRLLADGLVGCSNIYIREYVPLRSYGTSIGGCPIAHEFRFFALRGKILCGAFYWAGHLEEEKEPAPGEDLCAFAAMIAEKLKEKAPFVVIDVAETEAGDFMVVELNDGQTSGLSCIRPETFYTSLADALSQQGTL